MHENEQNEPVKRDWTKTLDLDRTTITREFVNRMENCMRQMQDAQEDLKQVIADAKEAEFKPRDVEAMKKIARLRLKDQKGRAQEQLEALERIGKAVEFDLFDWAGVR